MLKEQSPSREKQPEIKWCTIMDVKEREGRLDFTDTEKTELSTRDIMAALEKGKVRELGQLDKLIAVPPHQNYISCHIVLIEHEDKRFLAIFKGLAGEGIGEVSILTYFVDREEKTLLQRAEREIANAKINTEWENVAYYPREVFAYMLSEKLNLGLVPPTALRTLRGKFPVYTEGGFKLVEGETNGALQVFLPFRTYAQLEREKKAGDLPQILLNNLEQYYKIAVFDYLVQIRSRHFDDFLLDTSKEESTIFLIDHGNSMLSESTKNLRSVFLRYFGMLNRNINFIRLPKLREILINLKENIQITLREQPEWFKKLIEDLKDLLKNKEQFEGEIKEKGLYGYGLLEVKEGIPIVTQIFENLKEIPQGARVIKLITREDLDEFWFRLEKLIESLENTGLIPIIYDEELGIIYPLK